MEEVGGVPTRRTWNQTQLYLVPHFPHLSSEENPGPHRTGLLGPRWGWGPVTSVLPGLPALSELPLLYPCDSGGQTEN